MLHGPQRGLFDLDFRVPAGCADQLASGAADIGIVPSFELTRLNLETIPGTGIACHGPVRSILLISSRPAAEIRTLAADSSSRTSVELARVILERKYGATPTLIRQPPDLEAMLRSADAALIIGDPALRIDPARLPYHAYDLGAEWVDMTGLPMVFAVWAAHAGSWRRRPTGGSYSGNRAAGMVAERNRGNCRGPEAPRREIRAGAEYGSI